MPIDYSFYILVHPFNRTFGSASLVQKISHRGLYTLAIFQNLGFDFWIIIFDPENADARARSRSLRSM
jgi:hypothetical protein